MSCHGPQSAGLYPAVPLSSLVQYPSLYLLIILSGLAVTSYRSLPLQVWYKPDLAVQFRLSPVYFSSDTTNILIMLPFKGGCL